MPTPRHIGLIMDGNRRWAQHRGLSANRGHRAGFDNLRPVLDHCFSSGIEVVSAYALSIENKHRRPAIELDYIMHLLCRWGAQLIDQLHQQGIRFVHSGSRHGLAPRVLRVLDKGMAKTAANSPYTFNLVFNHGGRHELVHVMRRLAALGTPPQAITEELIETHLFTAGLPDLDLVVRTGGDYRLSNFLPWQCIHAWLHITPVYWPDLTAADLDQALTGVAAGARASA
ncbi:MAG: di-trans,poly-cis-decaprenylcistransferase [Candidatus Latescibacteria bacterium]|nr:di-trans,poly-cis-decaprenylcistransferase [Candidatus Latescibacterota bacterium]